MSTAMLPKLWSLNMMRTADRRNHNNVNSCKMFRTMFLNYGVATSTPKICDTAWLFCFAAVLPHECWLFFISCSVRNPCWKMMSSKDDPISTRRCDPKSSEAQLWNIRCPARLSWLQSQFVVKNKVFLVWAVVALCLPSPFQSWKNAPSGNVGYTE